MIHSRMLLLLTLLFAGALPAQSTGGLVGRVVDATSGSPLAGATVTLTEANASTRTDRNGEYRIRGVVVGYHTLRVTNPGYRPAERDSILVRAGEIVRVDVRLAGQAVDLGDLVAVGVMDPVLDPLATQTVQRISAEDLRRLPVSSLDDAIALQAGVVGESFRGGRVGQQSFILDGLGLKNQLDASTNGFGLRIPTELITEAQLVTNGFSARFGQALSGLVSVNTRDGGDVWRGRLAYETDRPMTGVNDLGLDRLVAQADGPLFGGATMVAVVDLTARLDNDPVNAPPAVDPLDPRHEVPRPLPHNSGENWSGALKFTIPMGERVVTRLFGLRSIDQQYLYDQRYKYEPDFGPGRRLDGSLYSAHVQLLPGQGTPFIGDIRIGSFSREFVRGPVDAPEYRFGAFTGRRMNITGEDLARSQDTIAARNPIPGFDPAVYSSNTPWGVPAFFLGRGTAGELGWNEFSELRMQGDFVLGLGQHADLWFGGLYAGQDVKTFQRIDAGLPVGDPVPPAAASAFSPVITAAYIEGQARAADLGFTIGVRYDGFDPGTDLGNSTIGARNSINPRAAVSTVLSGATVVGSVGKFSQPPDLQYLIDAAFDDTTRTGRFRQGNPDLGFETGTQFELSARIRVRPHSALRINVFNKRLEGLVSTTPIGANPDSSRFANADFGTVVGGEVIFERERTNGWGARLAMTVQRAEATVTDAFELQRIVIIDPATGDTLPPPARAQYPLDYDRRLALLAMVDGELNPDAGPEVLGVRPLGGMVGAVVGRYGSGLPYSRTDITGDSLVYSPNGSRLPAQWSIDALLRRPLRFGNIVGGVYLDVRNVTNRRNLVSVRRDTGLPDASESFINTLAEQSYQANPGAIPFESSRYRRFADLNNDGTISGREELMPLYIAAARDFTQPLFVYGPPRQIRFGMELNF